LVEMGAIMEAVEKDETGRVLRHSYWVDDDLAAVKLGRAVRVLQPVLEAAAASQENGLGDRRRLFNALGRRGCRWYAWKLLEAFAEHRTVDRRALVQEISGARLADTHPAEGAISRVISDGIRGGAFTSAGGGLKRRATLPAALPVLLEVAVAVELGERYEFHPNVAHVATALRWFRRWTSVRRPAAVKTRSSGDTLSGHAVTATPPDRNPPERRPQHDETLSLLGLHDPLSVPTFYTLRDVPRSLRRAAKPTPLGTNHEGQGLGRGRVSQPN
jgi:hypothetical protein